MRTLLASAALSLLLSGSASADTYINGVNATGLMGFTLEEVKTVTFDANGDIHIDAPGYNIEVASGGPADEKPVDAGSTVADGIPVEAGKYWLVVEDNNSQGHAINIIVNERIAKTFTSGGEQLLFDLAPFLVVGDNEVRIQAQPGAVPSGGALKIYIGQGTNDSGELLMDRPDIAYSRDASAPPTGDSRTYTLTIR